MNLACLNLMDRYAGLASMIFLTMPTQQQKQQYLSCTSLAWVVHFGINYDKFIYIYINEFMPWDQAGHPNSKNSHLRRSLSDHGLLHPARIPGKWQGWKVKEFPPQRTRWDWPDSCLPTGILTWGADWARWRANAKVAFASPVKSIGRCGHQRNVVAFVCNNNFGGFSVLLLYMYIRHIQTLIHVQCYACWKQIDADIHSENAWRNQMCQFV